MDNEEILLVRRAQQGDQIAFEKLMICHDRNILRLVQLLLSNSQDAQDVYQETFLKAFTHIHTFRFESEFKTWLTRISINLCMNRRRQRRLRQWFSLDAEQSDQDPTANAWISKDVQPDEQLQQQEIWQHLNKSLDSLSIQQRTAFTLKHVYGYSIKEIAGVLQCAEGTVKNHLFRAVQKLKKNLQPFYP